MASSLPASKILMVMVVDDAKDGEADKEADLVKLRHKLCQELLEEAH